MKEICLNVFYDDYCDIMSDDYCDIISNDYQYVIGILYVIWYVIDILFTCPMI